MSGGRPTDYLPDEHPAAARLLVGNGKTMQDLAELLGIAQSTLTLWRQIHPEFSASIALGKEDATDRVERSLFERATGYTFASEKIVVVSNGGDAGSSVERVPIKEHCPPDVGAQKYWLGNRRPKEWSDAERIAASIAETQRPKRVSIKNNTLGK